jgi:ribosomal protein L24
MAEDEESEPEFQEWKKTDSLGRVVEVYRRGDRVLITGMPELGQVGRIAKLFHNDAKIELRGGEFVRVKYKDLELTARDGPLGPLGSF